VFSNTENKMKNIFFPRSISLALKNHLGKKAITVLTGMRRVGKTTLVKQLFSEVVSNNKAYFDLERLDNRELFSEKNYEIVVSALQSQGLDLKKKLYLVIDEIQLVSNIASVMKYLYDHYNIKFIVTGSSSFYLRNLFSESLAGRKKIFELFPLDFNEFLVFKNVPFRAARQSVFRQKFQSSEYERLKSYYEEYVRFGGFPEVVLAGSKQEKTDLLTDIISSYVNVDIVRLSDFKRQKDFYGLIKMLVGRIGSRLDYVKLSQLTGISRPSLINYLEFLEKTYLIYRIPVFTKSRDREIVKAKKLYFCDTGLANILSQISSGQQFENTVFNQLRPYGQINYFSLKTGREIDFVLDQKKAIEVKETPTQSNFRELSALAKKAGLKEYFLMGRHPSLKFKDFIWAGSLI